jgi:peptide chain release factor 2
MSVLEDIKILDKRFVELADKFDLPKKRKELEKLKNQLSDSDVWNDPAKGQQVSQKAGKLERTLEPWLEAEGQLDEIVELAETGDQTLSEELSDQVLIIKDKLDNIEKTLKFSGPYDDHDVILRLHAGAGGVDAMDWTAMLLRMYLRWGENSGYKTEVLEQSSGDEAGIKSAVVSVSGPNAYGRLSSEHGVHRLVRLSPFNADNLRQTSFAMVEVLPQIDAPEEVEIDEKDLKIDVYRSGGHGGQSVNTTDSAVRVTHLPTNIVVAIQNERSQLQNKETAMKILRSKLAQLQIEQHAKKISDLKGPNQEAAWGNQIRNYVLHPYKQVKDTRTKVEVKDAEKVLDGYLDPFLG